MLNQFNINMNFVLPNWVFLDTLGVGCVTNYSCLNGLSTGFLVVILKIVLWMSLWMFPYITTILE